MQLSPALQAQVKTIAHRYGSGWDGDDLSQDCFAMIYSPNFPDYSEGEILKACHNLCINKLRSEKIRATESLSFEPVLYGESVDVEKYIEHIDNLRLQAIVDQFVDGEKALSNAQMLYLGRHRQELDRDLRKYLKQKSAWQIFIEAWEPYHRTLKELTEHSLHLQMVRAQ